MEGRFDCLVIPTRIENSEIRDMKPIPVIIIDGFLDAGKTILLN